MVISNTTARSTQHHGNNYSFLRRSKSSDESEKHRTFEPRGNNTGRSNASASAPNQRAKVPNNTAPPHHHHSNNGDDARPTIESLVVPEIQAVFFWATSSCVLRIAIAFLVSLASLDYGSYVDVVGDGDGDARSRYLSLLLSFLWDVIMTCSYLAKAVTSYLLPRKSTNDMAPAFIFGSTWILYPVQRTFGPIPNIPTRIAEMIQGRLTIRDIALILPIHFLGAVLAAFLVRATLSQAAVEPILYSEDRPWAVDLVLEIVVNALYSVAVVVLPELCELNRVPTAVVNLCLYPLFSFGVDGTGRGSTYSPNVVYALWCVSRQEEIPFRQSSHMLGPVLGGILGGLILQKNFPDD